MSTNNQQRRAALISTSAAKLFMVVQALALFLVVVCPTMINADATLAPPEGKYLFGAWLDTTPIGNTNVGKDSPREFNGRIGFNASIFQYAQNMPFTSETAAPLDQVFLLSTDAIIELTIYPETTGLKSWKDYSALDEVSDININQLITQIGGFVGNYNATFLIRLMPEMNGNWMPYGQRPLRYVETWRRVVDAFDAAGLTPYVDFVWAPNPALNYPYGGYTDSIFTSKNKTLANVVAGMEAEFEALDTNQDGVINSTDDPFSPYWPGDEYVDWVGLSIYFFGHVYPWLTNVLPNATDFESTIKSGKVNIYEVYSEAKDKPFMITETSAAYHELQESSAVTPAPAGVDYPIAISAGAGNLAMKQTWFESSLGNDSFWQAYPLIRALCLFEYQKIEELTFRNFQVTNRSIDNGDAIVDMFLDILDTQKSAIVTANYTYNPNLDELRKEKSSSSKTDIALRFTLSVCVVMVAIVLTTI